MVYSNAGLQLSLTCQTEESDVLLAIRNYSFVTFSQMMETQISVMGDSQGDATAEVSSDLPVEPLAIVSGADYVYDLLEQFVFYAG